MTIANSSVFTTAMTCSLGTHTASGRNTSSENGGYVYGNCPIPSLAE